MFFLFYYASQALQWESDRRFFAVGPAGAMEFDFRDATLTEAPSIRYRALLKPEEVTNAVSVVCV